MEWKVEYSPSYSILKVFLRPGESVTAEAGAYVLHKGDIDIKTHTGGGLLKAFARAVFAEETVFVNTFTARSNAELWFAPGVPGDIKYIPLEGRSLIIQDTSYLAHHGDVDLGVAWRGFRGLLAEGSLVWFKTSGYGGVWINSYGAMEEVTLGPGERMTVDNFHFVAMDDTISWRVRKFGGIKSFIFGGEGVVIEIEGPGRVYLQTRTLPPLAAVLRKFIRK